MDAAITASPDDMVYDPNISLDGGQIRSIDISNYLKSSDNSGGGGGDAGGGGSGGGSGGSGGGGSGGSGGAGGGGGVGGDPPVATYVANQASLDFAGAPILITDTAAAVSGAFDTLSNDPAAGPASAPGQPESYVFPVTVALAETAIDIGGVPFPLNPGMTVSAEIKTDSRRVIDAAHENRLRGDEREMTRRRCCRWRIAKIQQSAAKSSRRAFRNATFHATRMACKL